MFVTKKVTSRPKTGTFPKITFYGKVFRKGNVELGFKNTI